MRSLSILNKEVSDLRWQMKGNDPVWGKMGGRRWGKGKGRHTLDEGEESGLWLVLIPPPSRRISAFVLAILLLSISKSALLVTGMTCGAKKIKQKRKWQKKHHFSCYLNQGLSLQYHNILSLVGLASYSVKNFIFLLSWHERNVCGIQQLLDNLR